MWFHKIAWPSSTRRSERTTLIVSGTRIPRVRRAPTNVSTNAVLDTTAATYETRSSAATDEPSASPESCEQPLSDVRGAVRMVKREGTSTAIVEMLQIREGRADDGAWAIVEGDVVLLDDEQLRRCRSRRPQVGAETVQDAAIWENPLAVEGALADLHGVGELSRGVRQGAERRSSGDAEQRVLNGTQLAIGGLLKTRSLLPPGALLTGVRPRGRGERRGSVRRAIGGYWSLRATSTGRCR